MSFSDKEIFFNYSYKGFFISDEIYTQLSYKKLIGLPSSYKTNVHYPKFNLHVIVKNIRLIPI